VRRTRVNSCVNDHRLFASFQERLTAKRFHIKQFAKKMLLNISVDAVIGFSCYDLLSLPIAIKRDEQELIVMLAKKAPNPTDKHVGSRVRMRRMMLSMSQEKLGDALGLTFQQVQKYEKGTNRIGASRLQQISQILQVPVSFFFEGAPVAQTAIRSEGMGEAPSPAYVSDFLATSDGLALTKAFMRIEDSKLRRRIVDLVEQIALRDKR
jgi:transcriptional regulator with XRE-family HTH domain